MAGGKVNAMENDHLNYEWRATAYSPPATHYVGLFSVSPGDDGTGGTEISGNAYARQGITRATGSWSVPAGGGISNANPVTFPVATPAGWGRVYTMGVWDAATAGNLRYVLPLVNSTYKAFVLTDTTNDDIEFPAHGFVANDIVRFFTLPGASLPAPLAQDTLYYVIATGLTTNSFRVSTTQGGAAVNITAAGAGEVAKDASFDVVANSQLSFAAGTIQVGEE